MWFGMLPRSQFILCPPIRFSQSNPGNSVNLEFQTLCANKSDSSACVYYSRYTRRSAQTHSQTKLHINHRSPTATLSIPRSHLPLGNMDFAQLSFALAASETQHYLNGSVCLCGSADAASSSLSVLERFCNSGWPSDLPRHRHIHFVTTEKLFLQLMNDIGVCGWVQSEICFPSFRSWVHVCARSGAHSRMRSRIRPPPPLPCCLGEPPLCLGELSLFPCVDDV